jgi:hypothetical protein
VTIAGGACEPLFAPRPLGPFLEIAQTLKGDLLPLVEQGSCPIRWWPRSPRSSAGRLQPCSCSRTSTGPTRPRWTSLRLRARRIESVPALVVASYRDEELDVRDPLRIVIGELATSPSISRMKLSGLSPAQLP